MIDRPFTYGNYGLTARRVQANRMIYLRKKGMIIKIHLPMILVDLLRRRLKAVGLHPVKALSRNIEGDGKAHAVDEKEIRENEVIREGENALQNREGVEGEAQVVVVAAAAAPTPAHLAHQMRVENKKRKKLNWMTVSVGTKRIQTTFRISTISI